MKPSAKATQRHSIIAENAAYFLDGLLVLAVVHAKEYVMHEFLSERAAELARLVAMIRSGLQQAEAMIPPLDDQLSELAMLGSQLVGNLLRDVRIVND